MEDQVLDYIVKLLQLVTPQQTETVVETLAQLLPECKTKISVYRNELPRVIFDTTFENFFLGTEWNQVDTKYRSPWSNKLFSPTENITLDGSNTLSPYPSESQKLKTSRIAEEPEPALQISSLSEIEKKINFVFSEFCSVYMKGGVSSVYLCPLDKNTFQAIFLMYNQRELDSNKTRITWSSKHVVTITMASALTFYSFQSTAYVQLSTNESQLNHEMGVNVKEIKELQHRSIRSRSLVSLDHITIIGPEIEALEDILRRRIENTFIAKLESLLAMLSDNASSYSTLPTDNGSKHPMSDCINELKQMNSTSTKDTSKN